MRTTDVVEQSSITFRRLDHWIRRGYVHATGGGSGNARDLDEDEARVVQVMALLVDFGMRPAAAANLARPLLVDGIVLSGHLQLTLTAVPAGPADPLEALQRLPREITPDMLHLAADSGVLPAMLDAASHEERP